MKLARRIIVIVGLLVIGAVAGYFARPVIAGGPHPVTMTRAAIEREVARQLYKNDVDCTRHDWPTNLWKCSVDTGKTDIDPLARKFVAVRDFYEVTVNGELVLVRPA